MAKIHLTIQGKGGSGKTTNTAYMAQYIKDSGRKLTCIDTDPVNASFHAYQYLNVKALQIMSESSINSRAWDGLVQTICTTNNDVVIDNGATSFISLLEYIKSNLSVEMFKNFGQDVYIHIPISGGESLGHTVSGMYQMIKQLSQQKPFFVVWLNKFLGPIERNGESFEQFEEYLECKQYIEAIIDLPNFTPLETFGRDLAYILANNMTFTEALFMKEIQIEDDSESTIKVSTHGFDLAMLQRISIIKSRIYDLLKISGVFDEY